jgi:hypothetical protein
MGSYGTKLSARVGSPKRRKHTKPNGFSALDRPGGAFRPGGDPIMMERKHSGSPLQRRFGTKKRQIAA